MKNTNLSKSPKEIQKEFRSICYKCQYARNVAPALIDQGYSGCMLYSMVHSGLGKYSHLSINTNLIQCQEKGLGWVQRNEIFGKQTETMINDALIVKCVTECPYFCKEKKKK